MQEAIASFGNQGQLPVMGMSVIGMSVMGMSVMGMSVMGMPVMGMPVMGMPVIGMSVTGMFVWGVGGGGGGSRKLRLKTYIHISLRQICEFHNIHHLVYQEQLFINFMCCNDNEILFYKKFVHHKKNYFIIHITLTILNFCQYSSRKNVIEHFYFINNISTTIFI